MMEKFLFLFRPKYQKHHCSIYLLMRDNRKLSNKTIMTAFPFFIYRLCEALNWVQSLMFY